ncbi:MAG: hypothetical protein OXD50_16435 [Chloroflexi bacterium]|nr:hypothetical protein [Chloroflexota bacterium]
MHRSNSFVEGGDSRAPSPVLWGGWFTLCAVLAYVLSELLADQPAVRFVIFAGMTMASVCLSIVLINLCARARVWLARRRGADGNDQEQMPPDHPS